MMMARFPAFMAGWSMPLPTVVDTILLALASAIPDRIPAAHSGSLGAALSYSGRDRERNRDFVLMSIESGGWGGRCDADGEDVSMSVCQGDVRNAPIENMELKGPVVVEERALRPDSGGAGAFRGGLGVRTRIRTLADGRVNVQGGDGGRLTCPPWGLLGGGSGVTASTLVKAPGEKEFHLPAGNPLTWPAGTEVLYMTAGGGGWGEPFERDPARVLRDVREGYVSADKARELYGVVLGAEESEVDAAATRTLRARLKSSAAGVKS
jgi:N-methylhydantoinase B